MDITGHQLQPAELYQSPHQDARPTDEVSLIVIHGISLPPGQFGGSEVVDLFMGRLDTSAPGLADLAGVRVSSHVYIRRTGDIIQFVPFNRRAWHAGVSSFAGRSGCNDYSIGIELEGQDDRAYEDAQYRALVRVCAALMTTYGISEIHGHQHIAPGRKTDPGEAFDWWRLRRGLARQL